MLFQIWVKKQSSGDWRPGFWSCVVVMTTVSWTASSSTNPGLFSPPALCTSYLLVTRDNPRWKKKGQSSPWPNPASLVMIWKQRGLCVLVFKATWRALFATQNFWNGEFMNTSSNNYMENILFFYKAHAYAIVLGWFPLFFPRTVLCFCW